MFEKLVAAWLVTDSVRSNYFMCVEGFSEWAERHQEHRRDVGFDLVATRHDGMYVAIRGHRSEPAEPRHHFRPQIGPQAPRGPRGSPRTRDTGRQFLTALAVGDLAGGLEVLKDGFDMKDLIRSGA